MDKYTRSADGTYSVAGMVSGLTEEQAIALTTETGVFSTKAWPFVERRQHLRAVSGEQSVRGKLLTTTTFEVGE